MSMISDFEYFSYTYLPSVYIFNKMSEYIFFPFFDPKLPKFSHVIFYNLFSFVFCILVMIHFELIFWKVVKSLYILFLLLFGLFVSMCMSSFSRIICWKVYPFSIGLPMILCQRSVGDNYVFIFFCFWFLYMLIWSMCLIFYHYHTVFLRFFFFFFLPFFGALFEPFGNYRLGG